MKGSRAEVGKLRPARAFCGARRAVITYMDSTYLESMLR